MSTTRQEAAAAIEGSWHGPSGPHEEPQHPATATRITDDPADDLRRYVVAITGSRPPEERRAAKQARQQARGQRTRLLQAAMGGTSRQRAMSGNGAYEAADEDLGGQLERGEGYRDPLVLSYAYHLARALMRREADRLEAQGDEIPF